MTSGNFKKFILTSLFALALPPISTAATCGLQSPPDFERIGNLSDTLFSEYFFDREEAALASSLEKDMPATGIDGGENCRIQRGGASYYKPGPGLGKTASGERLTTTALTAAHRTLPFGTRVKVTNIKNGRSVIVRINDRGPFVKSRVIDVSLAAAKQIGLVQAGHGQVEVQICKTR